MPESDAPRTPGSGDVPESWGFHLLQELRRLEDKMDARFDAMDTKFDAKIGALDTKFDAKIDRLDAKFTQELADVRQEIRGLRYWSWGAILTVVAAAVATILTVLLH